MKPFLACLCLLFTKAHAHAEPAVDLSKLDLSKLDRCIIAVEDAPHGKVGRSGERSRRQFMRSTWEQYSAMPFYMASARTPEAIAEQDRVAACHMDWLLKNLPTPTPYRLALAWNAGLDAVLRGHLSRRHYDYANRVRNLYDEKL